MLFLAVSAITPGTSSGAPLVVAGPTSGASNYGNQWHLLVVET
jgi:hypothetical protein